MSHMRAPYRSLFLAAIGLALCGCVSTQNFDRIQLHDGEWMITEVDGDNGASIGPIIVELNSDSTAKVAQDQKLVVENMRVCGKKTVGDLSSNPVVWSPNAQKMKCCTEQMQHGKDYCAEIEFNEPSLKNPFHLLGFRHNEKGIFQCVLVTFSADSDGERWKADPNRDRISVQVFGEGESLDPDDGGGSASMGSPRPQIDGG